MVSIPAPSAAAELNNSFLEYFHKHCQHTNSSSQHYAKAYGEPVLELAHFVAELCAELFNIALSGDIGVFMRLFDRVNHGLCLPLVEANYFEIRD